MHNTRRMVLLALFIALASVLHVVESWLPLPLPVPGIKLGLANIISMIVIVMFGWRDAIYVAILRVFLAALFGGIFLGPAFAMSLSGAIGSIAFMAYVYHHWHRAFSVIGISIIGAVVHNVVQITVAALLVSSITLLWYLPYLILFALPTGLATGMTTLYFLAKVPQEIYR
ncbi:MAG: Heptaprenyl diphosphate synthase component [Firmicutes bacterium]|nr:Heptaprenyl diphosphate synthase component [Bacillota bacterium]